jgi:hypothetical protein
MNPSSNFYINDGTGEFKNQSRRFMAEINELGMVTDAEWSDIDKDGYIDLIVTQDWGQIVIFKNERGRKMTLASKIKDSEGLWNCIKPTDVDGDGDTDFIVGNIGDNSKLKVSPENPAFLHVKDFDNNGTVEQIISCLTEDGKTYTMVLKGELQRALPMIKRKYVKYTDYANQSITDMFTPEQMKDCVEKKITTNKTVFLINDGKGNFEMKALPIEAQFSRISAIETGDFDKDGILDILLAGNFYDVLPEWGRFDANYGLFLKGKGKGNFEVKKSSDSGFKTVGQVRKMYKLRGSANQEVVVLAKNNDKAQVFSFKK